MIVEMPDEDEAVQLIEAQGHALRRDEYGLGMVEWGDTPCCGPQCVKCGDAWCLWERWLNVERCES